MEITAAHTGPERTIIVLGAESPDGWLFLAGDGVTDAPQRADRFKNREDARDARRDRMGAAWQPREVTFCVAFEVSN